MSRKLKILMITPQFRPLVGGYERAAERLSMELAERGHDVTIIAERRDWNWPRREMVGKAKLYRTFCIFKRGFHKLTSLAALAFFLITQGWKFDIWHVHQYGDYAGLAIALSRVFGKSVVLKLTSSGVSGLAVKVADSRLPGFSRFFHRKVDAVCATSDDNYQEALDFGIPANKIHRFGNGIEIDKFVPHSVQSRAELKLRLGLNDRHVALFVGRLHEPKNAIGMVEAWSLALPRLDKSWDLVILGEGPERSKVEAYCRTQKIESRVRLVGYHTNVNEWLGAADLFVLPSWFEGMSNSLLEAMACGLPTVCTAVSGTNELVARIETGIVVPIGDMTAFADAIVEFSKDEPRRIRAGQIARKAIEQQFSLESVTSAYETLYHQLSDRCGNRPADCESCSRPLEITDPPESVSVPHRPL